MKSFLAVKFLDRRGLTVGPVCYIQYVPQGGKLQGSMISLIVPVGLESVNIRIIELNSTLYFRCLSMWRVCSIRGLNNISISLFDKKAFKHFLRDFQL